MRRFFVGRSVGFLVAAVIVVLFFWAQAAGAVTNTAGAPGLSPDWSTVPPRDPATISDWYIHSFDVALTVNPDSSISTVETIVADAGNLTDKHGIFAVIPTRTYLTDTTFLDQPVELSSITDGLGQAHPFTTTEDAKNHTITYKIGSASETVSGLVPYVLTFETQNAVRFHEDVAGPNAAELYWDVLGAFWELEIDNFRATITFPTGFDNTTQEANFYGGAQGDRDPATFARLAKYSWTAPNVLVITARDLDINTGLTVSVTAPTTMFTPSPLGVSIDQTLAWWWGIWWLLIPLSLLIILFNLWQKHGDDPNVAGKNVLVPEFDVPQGPSGTKLDPLNMELIWRDGNLTSPALSAAIIQLAVNGYLTIEEITTTKALVFKQKDHLLKRTAKAATDLSALESLLLDKLFGSAQEVTLSSLKNKFYTKLDEIKQQGSIKLVAQGVLETTGRKIQIGLFVIAVLIAQLLSVLFINGGTWGIVSLAATLIVILIFAVIMPRRPEKGWELHRQIRGFKHYLQTAETRRQQFFEQENLWERLLPYAILFGLTAKWATILKELAATGGVYAAYHPVWWIGTAGSNQPSAFNVNDFATQLNSVSSAIGTSMTSSPSSSGSGGGGFSGGGGGGGGGGGW